MRLTRRPLLAWLLGFFVLCMQLDAPLHALTHALEEVAAATQLQKGLPSPASHAACPECLALSPAGAALMSSFQLHLAEAGDTTPLVVDLPSAASRNLLAYRAQAPPSLPVRPVCA